MTAQIKVILSGFELEEAEKEIIEKTIQGYLKKIEEASFGEELRLNLKKSQHGKTFLHEIQGDLISGKARLNAKVYGYNLYKALDGVLEKILNEAIHKSRTSRQ